MADFEGLLRLRERPPGPCLMYQSWRELTFLHYPCDPAIIQALLPPGLRVETYPDADGVERAWVGFVPFRMEGIRFRGFPAVPGLSAFPETNVRTYVTAEGSDPGVWFFSLDAQNILACRFARRFYGLPYHYARMSVSDLAYVSHRGSQAHHDVRVRLTGELRQAEVGTFEFWLLERYLLYSYRNGSLWRGRVGHTPYTFQNCVAEVDQRGYLEGVAVPDGFVSQLHSPGVDVEVFAIERVK
ncbi:MAG: YqjF family protein [Fimbriimonas sp.]